MKYSLQSSTWLLNSPSVNDDVHYWGPPQHLLVSMPLGGVTSYITMFTVAPLVGWVGTCLGKVTGRYVAAYRVMAHKPP